MKKIVLVFTFISIWAKIVAFGRELILSYCFGAGQVSDVFILSMTLPVTIFGFIATGVISGYIPVYQKAKSEEGQSTALSFTNNVINSLVLICVGIIIVYYIAPKPLLGLFASGFDDVTLELARRFTDFSIWVTLFTAVVTVLSGYLQINDKIRITALVSVPLNVGVIVSILAAYLFRNIYLLPVGFLLSSLLQVVFIWIISARTAFKYSLKFDWKDKYIKAFFASLTMLILSGSLQQVNVLIDRTLATTVIVGGLSIFEYANRVSDFVMGLTIIPISTAIFPLLTKSKEDSSELSRTLIDGIRLSAIIIIPASIILILYSETIVRILYCRGAFTEKDVVLTADIVKFYGAGLLAFSIREMVLKCFYALGDVKSPMINSTIGILCNIVLNFVLLRLMGLGGLALATSVSAVLCVVLLYISLRRRVVNINMASMVKHCCFTFVVAAALGYGSSWIYKGLSIRINGVIIPFIISIIFFGIMYFIIALLTGMISIKELKSLIHR